MLTYFKGVLVSACFTHLVLDVQGIGYAIFIPHRLMGELPPLGETIQLHTTFVVRECSHALYGFLDSQERDAFDILINVTGVGPKLALSLIGHLTFSELQSAVIHQDLPTLCRVPGVGKKTAERLVVELKDKISERWPTSQMHSPFPLSDSKAQHAQDAMQALMNLGYSQGVAQKAIQQTFKELSESADLASLITAALKNI